MMQLSAVTFLVRDYDEAIAWFCDKLGFELLEDIRLSDQKRWVRVAAANAQISLLLAKADTPRQRAAIGQAAGDRVAYFLNTTNFAADYERMIGAGVSFRELPRHEVYGTVAVFTDLYGNAWDLIQPAAKNKNPA
jgi:catechol 2,3-dioxygenase-like lactoylglutathione lyase family enzyme